eukprot:2421462-Rhodomonas_salina.1
MAVTDLVSPYAMSGTGLAPACAMSGTERVSYCGFVPAADAAPRGGAKGRSGWLEQRRYHPQ